MAEEVDLLRSGRHAHRRRRWDEAFRSLNSADRTSPLRLDDLEILAAAAYLTGRFDEHLELLERAHHTSLSDGDAVAAARHAFWLGLFLLFRGEAGHSTGWLARAHRLIGDHECVEQGDLLLPAAEAGLRAGRGDETFESSSRAAAIGDRFADLNLVALARHLQGLARLSQGRT